MTTVGSGTKSETFAISEETVNVTVVPRTITQATQIARYFTEDLTHFIEETKIDLIRYLQIQDQIDYPQDIEEVVGLLYDDISHMILDGLISGINLLISDDQPTPNLGGAYMLRYHATYLVNVDTSIRSLRKKNEAAQRFGGYLAPPPRVWRDGHYRFDLLIDWNPTANKNRRSRAMRPIYNFDWVPPVSRFDGTNLIRYREGGMTMDGAVIVSRDELAGPGYQGR